MMSMKPAHALLLLVSCSACSVFEPPFGQTESDGSMEASTPNDAGDASSTEEDASVPVDAGMVVIPTRPLLASCGFGAPTTSGVLSSAALDEVSGMAASRAHPRVLWMIEDSGSAAIVHAVNDEGTSVGVYQVGGAAIDYEDLAIGPGPDSGVDYLYIADIGNNNSTRATRTVYRVREPNVAWNQAYVTASLTSVEPLPFTFPAGRNDNAEALFVDPDTQDIYVVTKNGFTRPNALYVMTAPHTPAVSRTLTYLGDVYAGDGNDIAITAADISSDGSRIMLRALHAANHWDRSPGMSIADTILTTTPCSAEVGPTETKGESMTLSANGYFTLSEGISSPLTFVPFALP